MSLLGVKGSYNYCEGGQCLTLRKVTCLLGFNLCGIQLANINTTGCSVLAGGILLITSPVQPFHSQRETLGDTVFSNF